MTVHWHKQSLGVEASSSINFVIIASRNDMAHACPPWILPYGLQYVSRNIYCQNVKGRGWKVVGESRVAFTTLSCHLSVIARWQFPGFPRWRHFSTPCSRLRHRTVRCCHWSGCTWRTAPDTCRSGWDTADRQGEITMGWDFCNDVVATFYYTQDPSIII